MRSPWRCRSAARKGASARARSAPAAGGPAPVTGAGTAAGRRRRPAAVLGTGYLQDFAVEVAGTIETQPQFAGAMAVIAGLRGGARPRPTAQQPRKIAQQPGRAGFDQAQRQRPVLLAPERPDAEKQPLQRAHRQDPRIERQRLTTIQTQGQRLRATEFSLAAGDPRGCAPDPGRG